MVSSIVLVSRCILLAAAASLTFMSNPAVAHLDASSKLSLAKRSLQSWDPCYAHSQCDYGTYCDIWNNCYGCSSCQSLGDSIDGDCSTCDGVGDEGGCSSHLDCDSGEYCTLDNNCFDCSVCEHFWGVQPIDGDCSVCVEEGNEGECSSHLDCASGTYCDLGNNCYDCEKCEFWGDSIDGECSACQGCSSHLDCDDSGTYCGTSDYCYDCDSCESLGNSFDGNCTVCSSSPSGPSTFIDKILAASTKDDGSPSALMFHDYGVPLLLCFGAALSLLQL